MTRPGAERTREMVAYARSLCEDIEFFPWMPHARSEFLYEVLGVAIAQGATTLNIPDTVGYSTPVEFGALIRGIRTHTPGIEKAIISVHCHNDLGMATANSLAAVLAGARQVECTVNGLGERAGNAALEEIVMALHTRRSYYGVGTNIVTQELFPTSRMVSSFTGLAVQANKAIVGANAFAHEAGIHQDGILKNRQTYEIMDARMVGLGDNTLVLGKHSGRHAFADKLVQMGYHLDSEELNRLCTLKELADRKKTVMTVICRPSSPTNLSAGGGLSPAAIRSRQTTEDHSHGDSATGGTDGDLRRCGSWRGPVDAVYSDQSDHPGTQRADRVSKAVTEGIDAVGEVTIRIQTEANGTTCR